MGRSSRVAARAEMLRPSPPIILLVVLALGLPTGAGGKALRRARAQPSLSTAGAFEPSPLPRERVAVARVPVQRTRYFVEFRSRTSFYGHTYVVYGELDELGRRTDVHYAGLYPEGGAVGFMLGHVMPVPATVDAVEDDLVDPITESYLRVLTPEQFGKITDAVERLHADRQLWNAVLNNCNDFAAELAWELGLRTPSTLLVPEVFIRELRLMNSRSANR